MSFEYVKNRNDNVEKETIREEYEILGTLLHDLKDERRAVFGTSTAFRENQKENTISIMTFPYGDDEEPLAVLSYEEGQWVFRVDDEIKVRESNVDFAKQGIEAYFRNRS